MFRFLWQNALRLGVPTKYYTVVESVRPSQRIGPDGLIVAESVATYVQMLELTRRGARGDIASWRSRTTWTRRRPVQLFGGGTLVFDQFGRLKLHIHKDLDDWRRQLRRLEYLQRTGRRDTRKRLGLLRRCRARAGVRRAAQHRAAVPGRRGEPGQFGSGSGCTRSASETAS